MLSSSLTSLYEGFTEESEIFFASLEVLLILLVLLSDTEILLSIILDWLELICEIIFDLSSFYVKNELWDCGYGFLEIPAVEEGD